jgi:diacylglycerol kinase (ATP)
MRVHVTAAVLVSLVGSGIPLGLAEKVTLIFCVLFIFFAEILNSALEALVDLATRHFDEKARITKDAAAASVLVLALGTTTIFAALLVHNWTAVTSHLDAVRRQLLFGLPLTGCAVSLMVGRAKSAAVPLLTFAVALGLWAVLLIRSESYVFSAMLLGLLILALAAALERRRILMAPRGESLQS